MKRSFFLFVTLLVFLFSYTPTIAVPGPNDGARAFASWIGQTLNEITPALISNADESGGVITLSTAGNYFVTENLIYPIVISADEVFLDLSCRKVSSSDGSINLITVNTGLTRIHIRNGHLINTDTPTGAGAGILVQNGSSVVQVEKVKIFGCGNGVKLNGQDGNEVIECELVALDLVSNTTGLVLSYADENIIKDCCTFRNTQAGFELLHSEGNCFYDCQALKTFGPQSTMGFTSRAGQSNLFQGCVAKKTKTSAQEFCNKAYGFLLTDTEEKTKIIDCIVNDTDMTSTVSAVAYGICLEPILLEGSDLLNFIDDKDTGGGVRGVAWSPDSNYIASGDEGNYVRVFRFDGSSLTHIDGDNTPATTVRAVDWSPDGNYIVSGDDGNYVRIFSFDGTKLTHIDDDNTSTNIVLSVAWSPNGKYIASGGDDNYVRVFSFDGSNLTYICGNNIAGNDIRSVSWSPDGKYIVSGDDFSYVRVFSFDGANLIYINGTNNPGQVTAVAWSPNGKHIATGDWGGYVRVFSFDGSSVAYIDGIEVAVVIRSVAWSPDGKYFICGDAGFDHVRLFSFDGSTVSYIDDRDTGGSVFPSAWSPDGKYLAYGSSTDVGVLDAMYGPQNCIVQECTVCDTSSYGQFVGTGIAGGGTSCFVSNVCCNNEVNFTFGIPNVFYGGHNIERNTQRPFDNISMPMTQ